MDQLVNKKPVKRYSSPLNKTIVLKKLLEGTEIQLENKNNHEIIYNSNSISKSLKQFKQQENFLPIQHHTQHLITLKPQTHSKLDLSVSSLNYPNHSAYFDLTKRQSLTHQRKLPTFLHHQPLFLHGSLESKNQIIYKSNNYNNNQQAILLQPQQLQQLLLPHHFHSYNDPLASQHSINPKHYPFSTNTPEQPIQSAYQCQSLKQHQQPFVLPPSKHQPDFSSHSNQQLISPTDSLTIKQKLNQKQKLSENRLKDDSKNQIYPKNLSQTQIRQFSLQHSSTVLLSHSHSTYTSLPELTPDLTPFSEPENFPPQLFLPPSLTQTPKAFKARPIDSRLRMNISGQYFDVKLVVLERHPDTLLGDESERNLYYDKRRHEYFFDRHRPTFEVIFSYYLHGKKIKRPNFIPEDVFLEELRFFKVSF